MTADERPVARPSVPSLRDLLGPLYQHRWAAFVTFWVIFGGAAAGVALMKPESKATMKLLVKRERMDPVMSPSANALSQTGESVTEDELNSEVEILKSRDLLEQVTTASGLVDANSSSSPASPAVQLSRAVTRLADDLTVTPIRRTTLIEVTYRSPDPARAAAVLSNLARLYVEKHLAVHRPAGAHEFFDEQTRTFGAELSEAEARLAEFSRRERVIAPAAERDSALQRLAEFESAAQQTQAALSEAEQRIAALDAQISTTPKRQTTQIQTTENGNLIRNLKAKLLELDLQKTSLLQKFTPQYPPVEQLQAQIDQTRTALADAQATPISAETTDQNPTHQWLRDERARVVIERNAQRARARSLARTIVGYRTKAQHFDDARARQEELVQSVKLAQEAHQLYQHKREEARISDALDRTRIANVSLAEAPTVPSVPSNRGRGLLLAFAGVTGIVAALLMAVALHRLNPYFRTADEVQEFLGVPVLATLPAGSD